MAARSRAVVVTIGIALLAAGGGGCYRGHGRQVILQQRGYGSFEGNHGGEPVDADPNGGYRPVQEYPVPAPAPAAEPDSGPSLQNNGSVSDPAATQRMLVPEAQPKPKFWQRIGNGFLSATDWTRGYRTVGTSALYEARAAGGQLAKKTAVAFKKPMAQTDDASPVSGTPKGGPIRFEPNGVQQHVREENDFETASNWYDHPARLSAPQIGSVKPVPNDPPTQSLSEPSQADFSTDPVRTSDQGPQLLQ